MAELPKDMIFHYYSDDGITLKVDAIQLVRCRECKWAEVDAWWTYCKLGHKEDTTNSIIYTCTYDFYCADGERRSDE